MTNTPPNEQPGLHDIDGGDSTNATQHVRKRDKVRAFLGVPKSKNKELKTKASNQYMNAVPTPQVISPPLIASQASGPPIIAYQATGPSIVTSQSKDVNSDDNKPISSS
ncbi:hypothetical protein BGX24_011760, partial [Mortierella sp. AD032]